jgi:hypothetical protein
MSDDYEWKERSSVSLTEKLLDEIQKSIAVFKPSKSLQDISSLEIDDDQPVAEIDIVISGGIANFSS